MTERLILTFSKNIGWYYGTEISSDEMSVLEMFLSQDYGLYKFSRLIKWIQDPNFHYTHANITFIEKDGNIITIGDLYDAKSSLRKFRLPMEKFMKFLNSWENVGINYPKNIIITKSGEKVTVQGKN